MSVGQVTPTQIWEIVKGQFEIENQKIDAKEDKVTSLEDKKIAYDHIDNVLEQLRSTLQNFTKTSSFLKRTVSSSDTSLVAASANSKAPETSFTFSSISQLATAARVSSSSSLGLTSGTEPYLYSNADVNGGADFNPNLNITNNQGAGQITAGTLTINDVQVDIDDADTVNTILTKINNAGAGVIATFDTDNDRVRISGTFVGSDEEITFSDGDTNFFTAMDIDTAVVGTDNEWEEPIADTPLGGAISAGYFTINNFTFYVDPATESLENVMRKVNNSNANVTMFYDEESNQITMQNKEEGQALLLSNDDSGILAAFGFMNQAGDNDAAAERSSYSGARAQFVLNGETMERETNTFTIQGVTFSLLGTSTDSVNVSISKNNDAALETTQSFVNQFNASISAIDSELESAGGPLEDDYTLMQIRNTLLNDVLGKIDNPGQYRSLVDIGFNLERSHGESGGFNLSIDEETFRDKLDDDELSLHKLFAYDSSGNGLLTDGGYAIEMRDYLEDYTRSVSGFFYKQKDHIDDTIYDIELDISSMEADLLKAEERMFYTYAQQIIELQRMQAQQQRVASVSQSLAAAGF